MTTRQVARQIESLVEQKAEEANVAVDYSKFPDDDRLVVCCDKPEVLIDALKADSDFKFVEGSQLQFKRASHFYHKDATRLSITITGAQKVYAAG